MARGLVGKALRGAVQGVNQAMPMIMEDKRQKNRVSLEEMRDAALAKRDARIQSYNRENQNLQNEFVAGENKANRRQQTDQFKESMALDREKLDLTANQISQQLEIGNFGIAEAKRLEGLYETIINPESSEEAIMSAVETINYLKGTEPAKYSAITLYGDENEFGVQTRGSGVLDNRTGTVSGISLGGDNGGGEMQFESAEAVRGALRSGRITRAEARRAMQEFN